MLMPFTGPILVIASITEEEIPYSILALFLLIVAFIVFMDDENTASTGFSLKRAKLEYEKEELLDNFSSSNNYKKYIEYKVNDADKFLSTMIKVTYILNEINNMTKDSGVIEELINSYILVEESYDFAVHILINPELLEENAEWVDYVHEAHQLANKYYYARYPSPSKNSDMSPDEIEKELKRLSKELSLSMSYIDSKDIEDFLIDFNYIVNSK